MISDLGAFVFFLCGPLLVLQICASFISVRQHEGGALRLSRAASLLIFPGFAFTLITLAIALVQNDYDLLFVAQNTSPSTPLLYKIVGVWGNHEGSLVLWLVVLSLFLALMVRKPASMPITTQSLALGFLGLLILGFYGFSAWLSNPFAGNGEILPGSGDLNPLLQDFGQSIHPPLLYLGYTAAGATFAVALAILVDRKLDAPWADWLRPWALLSWTLLTAGIALGSWWAYYELGWGGWWFWDPVENLAFMPWLLGTALIHSLQVMRARGQLAGWSLLLAIMTFVTVLMGTFIVRSGLLTSVHAFASDPERGLYLLVMLLLVMAGAIAAYAQGIRNRLPDPHPLTANREGALLLNNLLLMTLFIAVLAGTLAPTGIELMGGETYVVREPFYIPTFVWPSFLLLALMTLGVWTTWKRVGLAAGSMILGFSIAGAVVLNLALALFFAWPIGAGMVFALGTWLMIGTGLAWARQIGSLQRLLKTPLARHAWALAHLGLGVAVLGMTSSVFLTKERFFEYDGKTELSVLGHSISIGERLWIADQNFQSLATPIRLNEDEIRLAETRLYHPLAGNLDPARDVNHRNFLRDEGQPTSEAAIFRQFWGDVFVTIQDRAAGAPLIVVANKSGVNWIWAGAFMMTLAGGIGLIPRVRRKGAV